MEVSKATIPPPPTVPNEVGQYLRTPVTDPDREPAFPPEFDSWFGDDVEEPLRLIELLEQYVEGPWRDWAETARLAIAARKLYEDLYELRLRLQRDEALIELVWGHAILSWNIDGVHVLHPLVTTRVQLSFDTETGAISVEPDSLTPHMDIDLLRGLGLTGFDLLVDLRDRWRTDPVGPFDERTNTLYHQLLAPLGLDGQVVTAERPAAPGRTPVITTGWVLFVRWRNTLYKRFFESLREALLAGNVPVSAPLASVVADEPSLISDVEVEGDDPSWHRAAQQLLMPLPSNPEQEAIARRLAEHRGVTVQGPPGTGKTHTIANLVSHLIGHGKRVLVASQKEQALTVLRDKIPESIRDLSVAVLGSSSTSLTQLDQSVQAIYENAVGLDRERASVEIGRLQSRLDQTRRDVGELRGRLETSIARERDTYVASSQSRSPSELAQWLSSTEAELGFIPDRIATTVSCPLTEHELSDLYSLASALEPADCSEARLDLPDQGRLPSGRDLAILSAELRDLRDQLADAGELMENRELFRQLGVQGVNTLTETLERAASQLEHLEQPWLIVIRSELANPAFAAVWRDQVKALRERIEELAALRSQLLGHSVVLPQPGLPTREFVAQLEELKERFAAGKGLSKIIHRELVKVRDSCLVDEEPPRVARDVELCLIEARCRRRRYELFHRWNDAVARAGGPQLDPSTQYPEFGLDEHVRSIFDACEWEEGGWEDLAERLRSAGLRPPTLPSADELTALTATLRSASLYFKEDELVERLDALAKTLRAGAAQSNASHAWASLLEAFTDSAWGRWDETVAEARRVSDLKNDVTRLDELTGQLAASVPLWASSILAGRGQQSAVGSASTGLQAWEWRQADGWVKDIIDADDPARLQRQLETKVRDANSATTELVAAAAWLAVSERLTDAERQALTAWAQALRKVGKGTGKYAPRWRAVAQNAMTDAQTAVPVWIMPTYRVVESFDPGKATFDVVILDESSQCDIFAIAALGIAHKAVVVGDDKQISPQSVGIEQSQVHDLIAQYIADVPHSELLDITTSLYDLSKMRFGGVITLLEHFRCLPEIIEFSNQLAYGGRILPLREQSSDPSWQSVIDVHVPNGYREFGTDTNPPEADFITEKIVELCSDPRYNGKTVGVISMLGDAQAALIEAKLIERIGEQEIERRRIRCGNAYHFQGDERHVMFVSLVVAAGEGRRIGPMTKEADSQRMNVAASRAQDQMWCVRSVSPDELHPDDVRARFIRYCQNPKLVDEAIGGVQDRFDSDFERAVYRQVVARGYTVKVQHRVGRFKIDLVIEGRRGRLAVELDGDAYHGPDRWEADRNRQAVLERLGWTFHRIRGSAYYRDPDLALTGLWERLEALGIKPQSEEPDISPPPHEAKPTQTSPGVVATRPNGVEERQLTETEGTPIQAQAEPWPPAPEPPPPPPAPLPQKNDFVFTALSEESEAPPEIPGDEPAQGAAEAIVYPSGPASSAEPMPTGSGDLVPVLSPYQSWIPRLLRDASTASQASIIDAMVEIVTQEGPIVAARLYELYVRASGGHRVGKTIRQVLNRAAYAAVRSGQLVQIDDQLPGQAAKTLYLPGTPAVVLRHRGDRTLEEVPRSEVAAVAKEILRRDPSVGDTELKRLLLVAYERVRLTENASSYLDDCIVLARI